LSSPTAGRESRNGNTIGKAFRLAVDQLGSDKAPVRLAGAYAVAKLADDWLEGQQECIDVLCAYIRMPYTPPGDDPPEPATDASEGRWGRWQEQRVEQLHRREEREVRHTILRLVGDHLRRGAEHSWRGSNFDFTGAVLDGGDFAGAVFSDSTVSFTRATFCSGRVDFLGATFSSGLVSFYGATFSGGEVNFYGARFFGGEVNFHGARFFSGEVCFYDASFFWRRGQLPRGDVLRRPG
jgi:hypothetical protein